MPSAMERLVGYSWPGNVRELENAIERACTLSDGGVIRASDLPPHMLHESGALEKTPDSEWRVGQQLDDFVRNQERKYIEMTLKFNEGSREKTASMLGDQHCDSLPKTRFETSPRIKEQKLSVRAQAEVGEALALRRDAVPSIPLFCPLAVRPLLF